MSTELTPRHAAAFGDPPTQSDKEYAALAHMSVFVAHFMGPLVAYLLVKDLSPYARYHAMQALILQVVLGVVEFVAVIFISLLASLTCGIGGVLFVFLIPVFLLPLWPAWKAYQGDWQGLPVIGEMGK